MILAILIATVSLSSMATAVAAAPEAPIITAHVVAHSHCDAGYHLSFEEYYQTKVKAVISTTIKALQSKAGVAHNRTFVWAETSYLMRWWNDHKPAERKQLVDLVESGRWEFINGGWVMHDEAVTTYASAINQMALGFQQLTQTIGINARPKYGWQIDPFGHSAFSASLWSQLGYSAVVLNRILQPIKDDMRANRRLQFVWRGTSQVDEDGHNRQLLAHVLDTHYDNPKLNGSTVAEHAQSWYTIMMKRAQAYQGTHLLVPFGGDFHFSDSETEFSKMELIHDYIRDHPTKFPGIKIRFSTLNDFFVATHDQQLSYPLLTDMDFFPYRACAGCDQPICAGSPCGYADAWWSGYYTVKPAQKTLSRWQDASLRSAELMYAMRFLDNGSHSAPKNTSGAVDSRLQFGRTSSALYTHHDAITGTGFPLAFDDYQVILKKAFDGTESFIGDMKVDLFCTSPSSIPTPISSVDTAHISSLLRTASSQSGSVIQLLVYNSLAWTRREWQSIGPITPGSIPAGSTIHVTTASGQEVPSQLITDTTRGGAQFIYMYVFVDPAGAAQLFLTIINAEPMKPMNNGNDDFANDYIRLTFDSVTSLPTTWTDIKSGRTWPFTTQFIDYNEKKQDPGTNVCTGGNVYVWYPEGAPRRFPPSNTPVTAIRTANGPYVWEVTLIMGSYVNQTYRLYGSPDGSGSARDLGFVESQTRVGPLPELERHGIAIHHTVGNMKSNGKFTTYDQGFTVMPRYVNYSRVVQANSYALVGEARVEDEQTIFAMHVMRPQTVTSDPFNTDRADGVSSLMSLLHRRLLNDPIIDRRAQDASIIDERTRLIITPRGGVLDDIVIRKQMVLRGEHNISIHAQLWSSRAAAMASCPRINWRPLTNRADPLPPHVHLLNVQADSDLVQTLVGMRLMDLRDPSPQAQPITVDLDNIFTIPVRGVMDMAIDLETQRNDLYPMIWPIRSSSSSSLPSSDMDVSDARTPSSSSFQSLVGNNTYTLVPQSVRSFRFFLFV